MAGQGGRIPYINASVRAKLDPLIDTLADSITAEAVDTGDETACAGMINYTATRLTLLVVRALFIRLRYWHVALIVGIFTNVKDEIYRRIGVPYEEQQCRRNGDVDVIEDLVNEMGETGR